MQELFSQLGIDWKLLLSQAVNFALLLVILRMFAYKPLLRVLKERQRKIAEGLAKAEEADAHLKEAHALKQHKLREAEAEALAMLRQTETRAQEHEARLMEAAKKKETELFAQAARTIEMQKEESRRATAHEAAALVKRAIAKAVELDPAHIDEALIAKAVEQVTHNNHSTALNGTQR